MRDLLRNKNFYFVLTADCALFILSLISAYALRFSLFIPYREWHQILALLGLLLPIKIGVFLAMGIYRGMWRYTSLLDGVRLAKASFAATGSVLAVLLLFFNRFAGYPRSVFIVDCFLTLLFCGGLRVGIRVICQKKSWLAKFRTGETGDLPAIRNTRLLLIGAGDAAMSIIREMHGSRYSSYKVVACVDDASNKWGKTLQDVPVFGPIARLQHFASRVQATELLIAMPSVLGDEMREIVSICKASGLPFKTLPLLCSLVDGGVTVSDIREVKYEDILGRPPVTLDWTKIGRCLDGKVVAVTGAGGSIGSELCRQLVQFKPAAIVLIDSSEFNLYQIENELREAVCFKQIYPVLGRVQDRLLMEHVFNKYRPEVVLHAAAFKHVPMVEINPWEGVMNNVVGSSVIMDVAEKFSVGRFVLVSTDKAVRPANVMGACKRMAEISLQSRHGKTRCMGVRFGNVLGSSGSVIPRFQEQIRSGGPVTVTHPEMTRYFMMIPEACQLILQALSMGEGGEIFILEMGVPVKINDMARDMIRLAGKMPERDVQIVYVGLRPGEKLYEELITHGEGLVPSAHEKIVVLRRKDSPVDSAVQEQQVRVQVERLVCAAATLDAELIKAALKECVPEYTPEKSSAEGCAADPLCPCAFPALYPAAPSCSKPRIASK